MWPIRSWFVLLVFVCHSPYGLGARECQEVEALTVEGLRFTQESSFFESINLKVPCEICPDDVEALRKRILNLQIFKDVQIKLIPQTKALKISLQEKWTLIPVIRAQYGGGTPLRVLGIYDTNSFGRFLTLGAELQKYGDQDPGYVFYFKAPSVFSTPIGLVLESWKIIRERAFYDSNFEKAESFFLKGTKQRTQLYYQSTENWRLGVDLQSFKLEPSRLMDRDFSAENQFYALPMLIYDDILVDGIEYHGFRWVHKMGRFYSSQDKSWKSHTEGDLFGYLLWENHWNLASHFFYGASSSEHPLTQFYLGGFDSIRGVPDGALWGNKALYGNLELRYLSFQWPKLHLQNVIFADAGSASSDHSQLRSDLEASWGGGLRFAIPQVHRLIFRFDIGMSLTHKGRLGISAGFNQLFQPYKPLSERS